MAKKKPPYTTRDITRLAHELGLPGNIGRKVIVAALIEKMGWDPSTPKKTALKRYFRLNAKINNENKFIPKKRQPFPKVAQPKFLKTFEWRKLRLVALKKYGAMCMCCGATPGTGAVMNVDHIKPRKTHPELALDIDNLQILCGECNHGKGNWDDTDFRPK
jgi:hypothetical protein